MMNTINSLIFKGSKYKLIFIIGLFLTLTSNSEFFTHTLKIYPLSLQNVGFLFSLLLVLFFLSILLLTFLSGKHLLKPSLILILLVSSLSSYFMNTYHIVIDEVMIQNIVETNMHEATDLLSLKQMEYFIFFGIIPSVFVYYYVVIPMKLTKDILYKITIVSLSLTSSILLIFIFSKHYTSFFREHKPLRFYTNPSYWIYASGKYIGIQFSSSNTPLKLVGQDAKVVEKEDEAKDLVILVIGEAARADRFSLNSYERETNALLKQEDILNFPNTSSCGTSTAVSVPCMFSVFNRSNYNDADAKTTENVLDVLATTHDVDILWRDNNSDSKGVALRVPYENYRTAKNNTICDEECRDEGMLVGLDKYIEAHKNRDILIVLHQMGNHGPAYYKRYPKAFEKFTPTCKTNQLEECTKEEISNAYDNAIVYTDYFLSKTIQLLKRYNQSHETAMIYMSDHGESLGEHGVYLHGLPYFMASKAQTNVASLMWFGEKMKEEIDMKALQNKRNDSFSHDNLFHTLLGVFDAKTEVYNEKLDILKNPKS